MAGYVKGKEVAFERIIEAEKKGRREAFNLLVLLGFGVVACLVLLKAGGLL